MLNCPQIPVVDDCAGQQNSDTADQWTQHCEPPSPTVDRFHRGVKTHGPTPEQCGTLRGCTAVYDLFNLALTAVTAHGQDGGTVHRK